MNRVKKGSVKDRRVYSGIFLAFLIVCVIMGSACLQYYNRLQETVRAESNGYMEEISKQMGTNVTKTMEHNFLALETVASVVESANVTSYAQLQRLIREQKELWGYQRILLIDENGIAHEDDGETIVLESDVYLQETVIGGKESMSTSQVINGKECIVFAIPLEETTFEGHKICALAAVYDPSSFDKIMSMTAFEGKSYAHIIRKDGTIVIRSSTEGTPEMGYNILKSLSNGQIKSGNGLKQMQWDIEHEKSGQTEFVMGETRAYMTYTPLGTQGWSLLTFVPVSVVNEKSDILLWITLLLCGLITLAFALLIFVMMMGFYRNRRHLESIAYVDSVTQGNTIQRFYELAQQSFDQESGQQYALVYINIEKFKVLNEQFGRRSCDEILRSIERGVGSDLEQEEWMGRLFADHFCVLVVYETEEVLLTRLEQWYQGCLQYMEDKGETWMPLILDFGLYVIDNTSLPMASIVDRAKLALSGELRELHGKVRYAIYDEQIRRALLREKQLEDQMDEALAKGEYTVFLQPKFDTQTEQIGGAEALVRWKSQSEGMIYPDEFIPLFEKNGFILQLDFVVFETVCKTIRKWLDKGLTPVKVSVNCSRSHLKNEDFLQTYGRIADQYEIPHQWIEIELTETVVFDNVAYLSQVIRHIHEMGFGCSMDDFGSGYSSLNLIQDIPVDTLKLDRIFFQNGNEERMARTESVVGSIVTMAKALSMKTVAEGVEDRLHVDMLKKLDCDYIQGYFFARPMPIEEFEELAFGKEERRME